MKEKQGESATILPTDLKKSLSKAGLIEAFQNASEIERREFIHWIEGAHHAETRKARIELVITMLREKQV
ncbi:MAG TPA: YdeI/OmpD-associated family protein [Candidatus Nanoarchaeia archaeon]|nr:YdeI/OmpD-associated family protein [Candidatus Nanoarchaeia archaeon]